MCIRDRLMGVSICCIIDNFSIDGSGIAFVKCNGCTWVTAKFTNIKRNITITACNDAGVALENNVAIVEAQRIVFSTHLISCINLHIFQSQICIVLDLSLIHI